MSTAKARHVPGVMNRLEADYAASLDARQAAGDILGWRFEPIKLRLADKTYYSPDFLVIGADLGVELHEVKGFMRDDANVKLKVAASQFGWFKFFLVTRRRKSDPWTVREV
jgi:hypothetical protein